MSDGVDIDKLEAEVKVQFDNVDKEGKGQINPRDVETILKHFVPHASEDDCKEAMDNADPENAGNVAFEDLFPAVASKIVEKKEMDEMKNYFRILDKNRNGFITRQDMKYLLEGVQKISDQPMTEEEIEHTIDEIDEDGNGEISFEEFYKMMTGD